MMSEIIASAESLAFKRPDLVSLSHGAKIFGDKSENGSIEMSIAKASVAASIKRQAAAIIVLAGNRTELARFVSAYRPNVPIVTFVPSSKVARQLVRTELTLTFSFNV